MGSGYFCRGVHSLASSPHLLFTFAAASTSHGRPAPHQCKTTSPWIRDAPVRFMPTCPGSEGTTKTRGNSAVQQLSKKPSSPYLPAAASTSLCQSAVGPTAQDRTCTTVRAARPTGGRWSAGLPVIPALRRARRHSPPFLYATDIDRRRRPVRYPVADPAQPASASEPPVLFSLASNLTHRSRAPRSTCADPDVDPDSQSQHLSPTGRRQSIHSLHESVCDADIYFVIVILLSRPSPKLTNFEPRLLVTTISVMSKNKVEGLRKVLANRPRKGKRPALPSKLVLATWSGILDDEQSLPADWLREPRVLVGKHALPPRIPYRQNNSQGIG
ncbi:hypothetical protein GGX14DRAFT_408648 [Mycena pura]|uniref:Uncharacterized protein n=1 Tax=Mycena pura TaxID=153505 RepID=A0AAD6UNV3_9AGAR|nr:hypothetical protein GGX14DRAFT_408648 [Mycena pura]